MDRYSELELKFAADRISTRQFMEGISGFYSHRVATYKYVAGADTYWRQGDSVVRHRCDGNRKTSTLTVKKRKSGDSITDRHEVDLHIRKDMSSEDVVAFLTMTGWERWFTLEKSSYIFHLRHPIEPAINPDMANVCVAYYAVWNHVPGKPKLFLEIEIERNSSCTTEVGRQILATYRKALTDIFGLGEPLNYSLQEMFAPKTEVEPPQAAPQAKPMSPLALLPKSKIPTTWVLGAPFIKVCGCDRCLAT